MTSCKTFIEIDHNVHIQIHPLTNAVNILVLCNIAPIGTNVMLKIWRCEQNVQVKTGGGLAQVTSCEIYAYFLRQNLQLCDPSFCPWQKLTHVLDMKVKTGEERNWVILLRYPQPHQQRALDETFSMLWLDSGHESILKNDQNAY